MFQEEVICKVQIQHVQEAETWFYYECTSCYNQVHEEDGNYVCHRCNDRIVPSPDKKSDLHIIF